MPRGFPIFVRECAQYRSRSELHDANRKLYDYGASQGWLDRIYPPNLSKWDLASVLAAAEPYETLSTFCEACPGAYAWAVRHNEVSRLGLRQANRWTEAACRKEASRFNTRQSLRLNNPSCYQACRRLGLLNELFGAKQNPWKNRVSYRRSTN